MSMWLYDEMNEMEDYQNYQKEVRLLEREYLEIRILLRDAEKGLESLAARLAADHPLEISLFAPPHG
jgi:hypothetical protein